MTIDAQAFRGAMRRLAAAVSVITTARDDGERFGLTATAVCSVSASPPMLLCCVNRANQSYAAIRHADRFAVNVLSLDDRPIADRFASAIPAAEKFASGLWYALETGAPVLEGALAAFDCRLTQSVEVATHGILFGEIHAVRVRSGDARPLLYAHGAYGGFSSAGVGGPPDADVLWVPHWNAELP